MKTGWAHPAPEAWDDLVWSALEEDIGPGDLSAACLGPDQTVEWAIECQAHGVLCGCGVAWELLAPESDDPQDCWIETKAQDGDQVSPGTICLEGVGRATKVLARERTALNFLMLLSGCATLTAKFIAQIGDRPTTVTDTRKTVPGMRSLQKYAVRCGGGKNHRMGLYDGLMIKDNHILASGGVRQAVTQAKESLGHMVKIEVECSELGQVDEAVSAGADVVMLDNMDPFSMANAVKRHKGRVVFEASGGVTLDTVSAIAATGVDVVSVGQLTHSAPALPFHLELR